MVKGRIFENGYRESFDLLETNGLTDYVKNGKIYTDIPVKSVMVGSENDLALLTSYNPGTFAYTKGYKKVWQKGTDGTWEEIV